MANTTFSITEPSIPGGFIHSMLYTPPKDLGTYKKYPLIIFFHGAGEGSPSSGLYNQTTVRTLEDNGHGIFTLTKSADLPVFTDPTDGTTYRYYMLGAQQYYPPGTSYATGRIWSYTYCRKLLAWAKANLADLDHTRIYLTGLSLGGGATWDALTQPDIHKQVAAAVPICAGYGNGSAQNFGEIAKSGVYIWCGAAINDTATNPSGGELVTSQICRKVNALHPVRSPDYEEFADGGHGIWYRFYSTAASATYNANGGGIYVHSPNMFVRLLKFTKKGIFTPYYLNP